jgi:hypothetical protein
LGTLSLSNSRYLPTISGPAMRVNPVTFFPGRARLATSPLSTGSKTATVTMGIVPVAFLAARAAAVGYHDVNLQTHQFVHVVGKPLVLPVRISVLDRDALAFDVAELA